MSTTPSSEVAVYESTALSLAPDQQTFTPAQTTALAHIGVENASPADLDVFFHVVKRTGLDPFARQIYMIGRKGREQVNGQWRDVIKQTIQTGIDGYRLIGRRAANAAKATVSVKAPEWAHREGGWREVWDKQWGNPLAARITITRSGEEFTATALFDEYAPRTREGEITGMWKQRPAGQLAKCAEALAWRMAFPQDLSGLYVEEEVQHFVDVQQQVVRGQVNGSAKDAVRAAVAPPVEHEAEATAPAETTDEQPAETPEPKGLNKGQQRLMHKLFNDLGITDKAKRMAYTCEIIGREIESSNDLTSSEVSTLIDTLQAEITKPPPEPDAPPADDEVIDGATSIVTELDEMRDDILVTAERKGRNLMDIEQAFSDQFDGSSYYHATAEQLVKFHSWVKAQRNAS